MTIVRPSVIAIRLTSRPSSRSSTRIPLAASANCGSPARVATAAIAAARSAQTNTPFPAARPSAFTTTGMSSRASRYSWARFAERNSRYMAVGTSPLWRICLQNALLPSIWAARAVGPKILKPAALKVSTIPATSGASGPMTVTSTARDRASSTNPGISPAFTATFSPIRAVPALPGAISTSAPSPASFQARACSRPPLPTTSTRREGPATRNDPFGNGERAGDDSDLRRRFVRSATLPERSRLPEGGRDANRRSRPEQKEGQLHHPRVSANSASRPRVGRTSRQPLPSPRSASGGRKGGKHAGGAGFAASAPSSKLTAIAQPIQLKRVREKNHKLSSSLVFVAFGPDTIAHTGTFAGGPFTKVREGFGLTR